MSKLLNEHAKGVYIIAATPFFDDDSIDYDSLDRLTDFYLEKGVSGITILGMMGEAQKLSPDESKNVMNRVIKRVDGRVPVIVGVSNPDIKKLIKLSNSAMAAGAAGIMVAPNSSHHNDETIFNYYVEVDKALESKIPMIYQDFPLVTKAPISLDCLMRIIREIPQVVMLKHEDWPGLEKLSELRSRSKAEGLRRISILCGNGGLYLPQELSRGADGAMTGFAYPEMLVSVCKKFENGDHDDAEDLFDLYLPVIKHEQQPGYGLAVRKETLHRRGAISSSKVRTPGPSMSSADHKDLDRLLERLDKRLEKT
ncbi:MAG: dihydrodipicolinate synthase family protein [Kordiimonadaceae bacterium]|jgi:4-hydroxy-tetrahydrodipicolinate synthase|nr:dihydrodipicolinate synthase family protein [Kordiimonadaceae bacterium]MBT6466986.1 dihydrodipicolinate synthase family protein [Kordiimonadaceae bacterium]MBT7545713.1 dihydrodipicolinate synthase family protein [Kordiimonadaceae bacterium]MBT7604607.1 dihydrodipicolinate synthase family protein [Kordiimonadaceae bacterium]|tara:strand:+ start:1411 stop:2343 length:933 start_codon:yes stop_codon:yes gene_type:complete